MEITTTSEKPFERLALDIVGPLPLTESGNRFILTGQDDLTKYCFAEAIPNHEASTIAKILTKYFMKFGIPKTFLTDQGSDFMSKLIICGPRIYRSAVTLPPARFTQMNPTILLLLLLPISVIPLYYTNSPITHASGMFYDKLGVTQICNKKLTLLTHINITYLNQTRDILKLNYIKSQNLCSIILKDEIDRNHVSFHCEQSLKTINEELQDIEKKSEILNHLTNQETSKRKRRGLINGVSYAINWLFGTPDAGNAQFYTDSINMLRNDNKQTQTLLKTQIQIISSTIRNFNNSLQSLKYNEDTMNENFKRIDDFSMQANSHLSRLALESITTQQITTLSSLTNRISSEYNKYIEAMYLSSNNILSPLVITPKIFLEELQNYKGEQELILNPTYANLHVFYKVMDIHAIMM
ncbi:hypothetical protein KPH14_012810 [Odynerus spinipes]|uniref:Integrase catalytic domain-containing protein n=1 Tax=Odynerus spinipes TaxID=1348599 RepID=A0AAD9R9C6_9HYME|nr:hypothetical protein KPH14_012810 [Odynerus spinipes]